MLLAPSDKRLCRECLADGRRRQAAVLCDAREFNGPCDAECCWEHCIELVKGHRCAGHRTAPIIVRKGAVKVLKHALR